MFDVPPKCPALANKLSGIFGWRQTYEVSKKQEGISHKYLQKSYSLALPRKTSPTFAHDKDRIHHLQKQSKTLDPDDPKANYEDPVNPLNPHVGVTSPIAYPIPGVGLQFRRSSDPNLHGSIKSEPNNRWSMPASACRDDSPNRTYLSPQLEEEEDIASHTVQPSKIFTRSARLSMQFLGDGNGYKWMEEAEKLQKPTYSTKSLPRETSKRKDPLCQAHEPDEETLLISNECGGPLGLTAIPDSDDNALLVQNVEIGSRAEKGRLRRGDRILEINGANLAGLSEAQIQKHLRRSLESSELRVRVIRDDKIRKSNELTDAEGVNTSRSTSSKVSPNKKSHSVAVGNSIQVANTRKLGRKIEINLKKGLNGLGFSVTTRDNPAGGDCPIYIKNILPRGAAIEDGRLKAGDRLLEVDGLSMTGKTQSDVVSILRSVQPGATVKLIVSRQEELDDIDDREINFAEQQTSVTDHSQKQSDEFTSSQAILTHRNESPDFIDDGSESAASNDTCQSRDIFTFHIPVHDIEKAGLGVSIKGKTSPSNFNGTVKLNSDVGIFVKNIIHDGAVSRDGRLRINDQLLSVNGVSLLGQTNAEAMETLRRALVKTSDEQPLIITLRVARTMIKSSRSENVRDNTQDRSKSVIYLSSDKQDCPNENGSPDHQYNASSIPKNSANIDTAHSSQANVDQSSPDTDHFSRDAIGRRSISEKHHAALDARDTGTYQRNKKIREVRERERRLQLTKSAVFSESIESLTTRIAGFENATQKELEDLRAEALDQLGDLGPSLGLKKSSSLESLQTMVQKIQMTDNTRGPSMLRTPRGRGCKDSLRAAIAGENDIGNQRKQGLLKEGDSESSLSHRNSLSDEKHKSRPKKCRILHGLGHMFRFGKNRQDSFGPKNASKPDNNVLVPTAALSIDRPNIIPRTITVNNQSNTSNSSSTAIHQNDIFNHRYQHYIKNEDFHQSELSRRHQHNHSQRITRTHELNSQHSKTGSYGAAQISNYYEYETIHHNISRSFRNTKKARKQNNLSPATQHPRYYKSAANGNSSKGPYVTQVTISDQSNTASSTSNISQQSHYHQNQSTIY